MASAGALAHSLSFCVMPYAVYPHRGAWTEGLSSVSLSDSDAPGCSTRRGSGYRGLCVRSSLLPRSAWDVRWCGRTKGHRQFLCPGKRAGVRTLLQHHTERCQPGLLPTSPCSWPLAFVKTASRYGIRKRYSWDLFPAELVKRSSPGSSSEMGSSPLPGLQGEAWQV